MSCISYLIQSALPGILGTPSADSMVNCSKYGAINAQGTKLCNAISGQCMDVPTDATNYFYNLNNTIGQGGASPTIVWLVPWSQTEKDQQKILGIFPWNQTQYKRQLTGTTTAIPVNPWDPEMMMANAPSIAAMVALGIVGYYGGKYVLEEILEEA